MRKFIFVIAVLIAPKLLAADGKKKSYSKTQEVSFEATNVDGTARTPDGAFVNPKKGAKFLPLYKVRDNFSRNVKESTQFLR